MSIDEQDLKEIKEALKAKVAQAQERHRLLLLEVAEINKELALQKRQNDQTQIKEIKKRIRGL